MTQRPQPEKGIGTQATSEYFRWNKESGRALRHLLGARNALELDLDAGHTDVLLTQEVSRHNRTCVFYFTYTSSIKYCGKNPRTPGAPGVPGRTGTARVLQVITEYHLCFGGD